MLAAFRSFIYEYEIRNAIFVNNFFENQYKHLSKRLKQKKDG